MSRPQRQELELFLNIFRDFQMLQANRSRHRLKVDAPRVARRSIVSISSAFLVHFVETSPDDFTRLALARLDDEHLFLDHVEELVDEVCAFLVAVEVVDELCFISIFVLERVIRSSLRL